MNQVQGLLCLTAILTIASWMYYTKNGNYVALNEFCKVATITKDHPLISALRDVGILSNETDCHRLFDNESSAHGFKMSKDFQENIAEFVSAVRANVGLRKNLEGYSYQMETQYKLLHYLVTNLKFVRTVCETGMNSISSSAHANIQGIA